MTKHAGVRENIKTASPEKLRSLAYHYHDRAIKAEGKVLAAEREAARAIEKDREAKAQMAAALDAIRDIVCPDEELNQ